MLKLEFDVDLAVIWTTVIIALAAILLLFWDIHYFLRTAFVLVWGRFFEDKISPEDTTTIYGKYLFFIIMQFFK